MLENEADSATADGTENENTGGADATESAASAQPQSAADNTPGADDAAGDTAGDAGAGRPRRASRPAGPPPDVEESRAEPPAAESEAPAPGDGEAADEPPKRTTRTRSRVRTRSGKAAETAEAVPMTGAETSPDADTEPENEPKNEPESEPKAAAAEPAEGAGETSTRRTRTRRRSTTAAASAAPSTPAVPPVPEVPAVPVAGAEPSTGQVSETEPASGVGIPGVTFQPPMVVFQPPQPTAEPAARPAKDERPARDERDESADRDTGDDEDDHGPSDEDDSDDRPSRRRRRRGGRGRGRGGKEGGEDEAPAEEPKDEQPKDEPAKTTRAKKEAAKKEAAKKDAKKDKPAKAKESKAEEAEHDADGDDDEGGSGTSRRRRRRRRRSGVDGDGTGGTDDPPNTVVHVRTAREARAAAEDEVQSVRGSTRLEAKKQRRREGREQGRRRPPVITEAEFLARRESVERVMVVRQEGERTQIAVLEDDVLVEHYVNRATHQSYVGNVYLGKVQNVLPSMEAAFVDIGKGRNAVLYAGEVNWDASGLEGQPRRIESALKSGQSVLVQVTKDPLGHKGARLTSQVSLPGRYLVYVPDGSMTGISRKLPDKERSRLKSILKKVMPENAGVIVRTAAEGATEEELSRDVSRLAAQWDNIQKKVKTASAPSLLYGEPDLTIRVVRDIFNEDFSKLVVSGDEAWDTVSDYVQYVAPHLADRVERWTGRQDALSAFRIDEQIAKALDRKVWLPSGGSLVIDRTEAMTVIDVNTGKFTGQGGNLEETVTRNNLEAAEEIVRQLRLRDIGGIVVIDFIDMVLESNRDLVLRRLVECLSRDRTKHQVAEVTSLGLVQMTRKRVGQGLVEAFSETCESCNGRGIHVHLTPVEPKAEKAAGKESGRRRRRKGEVERAVEEKLAEHESARTPEPEPVEVVEVVEPEPVEPVVTRPRRSRPAKRPAGPPPEIDADEPPAQAAVEAAQAADETADTAPGALDSAEPEPAPDVRPEPAAEPVAEPAAEAADAAPEPEPPANGAEPPADTSADTASEAGPVHADLTAAESNGTESNGTESNGTELNGTAPAEAAAESDEEEAPGRRRRVRRSRAAAPASAESDVTADTSSD
ncbi:Rne/Rng family ribonuclease [Actinomadura decatromicini]|uniref:Ribonuclease E n=1 Tax=Actinomadura decatromicini TaxID=2604572 RepID=A0A5D3FYL2_9ACTN|nr:Rne/Rng family ribonuclease [Actinomadura decatromicini]TYK52255.1 Rne/Rng family ribonuclease [Actinomadura decatromicini]